MTFISSVEKKKIYFMSGKGLFPKEDIYLINFVIITTQDAVHIHQRHIDQPSLHSFMYIYM